MSLQGRVDGTFYRVAVGQHAGQPLHDRASRVRGNAADIAHRRRARRGNGLFGLGELLCQPLFQRLTLDFGCRVQLLPGLGTDRLRTRARRRQFAFIGLQRAVEFILQPFGLGKVAVDRFLALVEQAADARQRNSRNDQIKRDKRNRQRDQLRRKGILLERWKRVLAGIGFGVSGVVLPASP